ncbi:Uncharacterised protein [uncultured archaeon]|nr:Uncharacterised protein [uncultured archaeon]
MIETLKLIRKNLLLFITAIVVDVTFFIAYGFYTAKIGEKITAYATLIINKLSIIMAEQPTGLLKHLFDAEIKPLTINLGLLVIIFFATTYILYCIFQGTSWWFITKINEKKDRYHNYLLGFARINLIWMAGYIIYKILDVIISVRYALMQKIAENATNTGGKILFAAALLLGITAFFSYPTLKPGTLFRTPLKTSILILIIGVAFYIAIQLMLPQINKINAQAALIIGTIILFTGINLVKVYTTRATNVHTRT